MAMPTFRTRRGFPWVRMFVLLGLAIRLYHYFRDPPVWHDEAALIVNVLDKSFSEQLGPLIFSEAAPPLFLWLEKLCVLALGDGTYALRLLPFLASCVGLLLFTWLARKVLRADAVPWAVLLFAFSDRLLWHTCEAKPYALDVLAAISLPALYLSTDQLSLPRRLLLFALVGPATIWLSFPGAFLVGGILIAFLPLVWRSRSLASWLAATTLAVAVAGSFLVLTFGPIRAQRCGDMESCWLHAFASWSRPWTIPWWSLKSSVEMVDYCFRPLGGVLAALALGGLWLWANRREWKLLALLVVPIALAWFAACLRAYPYTGARVMVYALPALALLIASVVPLLLARAQRWLPTRVAWCGMTVLFLPPLVSSLVGVVSPWTRTEWNDAMDYVGHHLQSSDRVVSNAWEASYYCREIGPRYTRIETPIEVTDNDRVWVLIEADTESIRRLVLREQFGTSLPVLSETHFPGVSVFCVGQRAEVASK